MKIKIGVFLFFCFLLVACKRSTERYSEYIFTSENADLPVILKEKKLVVLIEKSPTSYYYFKGTHMGFEYEVLKAFAKELGVKLELVFIDNLDNAEGQLLVGDAQILACSYTITKDRRMKMDFSTPYLRTSQVLIQRMPNDSTPTYIKDPIQLVRKKVTVWKKSSYYHRLKYLEQEIGDSIYINAIEGKVTPEELIKQVAEKKIDYTVVDNHIAVANSFMYRNLDHHLRLSLKQQIAFGLRNNTPLLKYRLNTWLRKFRYTPHYRFLKQKYFFGKEMSELTYQDFLDLGGGRLSAFDNLFKKEANKYDEDWHLIAAIVQQESNFKPYIKGKGGAFGLMQFMPSTGKRYGVHPDSSPSSQIKAGMKKIHGDLQLWKKIPNRHQRIKFALATYNAGHSPIQRAQNLAIKQGLNPNIWDGNVELALIKGRGKRTVNYVKEVYNRYTTLSMMFE
jgi:membrane-bound lytic murein transglycosylase F